ncbi:FecR family protein [Parabacteroides sp. Marseille-P3160]|uniref:FecR family protein n=1 Tax=Parabacteroides sp. Marseille-P3160 TaxID=1917887 RepID=UPI0009B9F4B8|nr:FecR domain-containing protein [Parabacteroides sp. Marseille-P3160]
MDERIIKYFQEELTEPERISLLKDAYSKEDLKKEMFAYQNVKALLSLVPENINIPEGEAGYKRLIATVRKRKILYYIRLSIGYAAAICLVVILTWHVAVSSSPNVKQTVKRQELYVPAGQRARITLPDGTTVWLNANSSLSYPSVFEKERKVTLTGEAYFDVAKDKENPFIVSTQSINIKALGTQFNVYSYPDAPYVSTTLISGSVQVYCPQKETESILLKPNQQLFHEGKKFNVTNIRDKDDLLWKEGIYNFKSASLRQIIKKLELYYDVKIIVKDPEIFSYIYTGKFRQRDGVLEILRIIQKIHHFKIYKDEELNQVTLSSK